MCACYEALGMRTVPRGADREQRNARSAGTEQLQAGCRLRCRRQACTALPHQLCVKSKKAVLPNVTKSILVFDEAAGCGCGLAVVAATPLGSLSRISRWWAPPPALARSPPVLLAGPPMNAMSASQAG